MGYNAKYCTYSIMSQSNLKILHFHVTMKKYGLVKALDKLQYWGLDITCITTDDHQSIKKYLKDKPSPCHQLDIWHKSKNITKKITCWQELRLALNWIKALINHFWCHCSTCNGDVFLLRDRLKIPFRILPNPFRTNELKQLEWFF